MDAKETAGVLAWMRTSAQEARTRVHQAMKDPDFGRVVGMGADGTPTLEVDRVAEAAVLEALDEAPIPLNVVSEEAEPVQRGAEYTLVLDPVDGSRNVVRRIPFYCISMAVGRASQRDVEVGLVLNFATGQEYTAVRGQGALLDGEPIKVRPMDPAEVIVATQLQYEKQVASRASGWLHVRSMGASALETCLVAQGSFDLFLARKPYLRIIDVSAAALILEEAGGQALTPERTRFDAPFDVTRRVGFIAVGDPKVLEVIA
jgi:fructose-1,6-bisphosphatase/inositol monophosphatase family enzyme